MVTRTVIRITSSEAEHWAAIAAAAAGDNSAAIKKANNEQSKSSKSSAATSDKKDTQKTKSRKKTLCCSHPNSNKRAQHPSTLCWRHGAEDVICSFDGCNKRGIRLGLCPDHGGLVQLCRWKGCINKGDLERRGGMCWMHHDDSADSDNSEEEDSGGDGYRWWNVRTTFNNLDDDCLDQGGGKKKKRSLPSWDIANNESTIKRQRQHKNLFVINVSDVPPQPPVPKSSRRVKEGASKYTGVCFNKKSNKWQAHIHLYGKQHAIGHYDNEEDAAIDYARAVFKYKGGMKLKRQSRKSLVIDLSGIPPQPPIPKSSGRIKEGASKYTGVSFHEQSNKWHAQIMIEGKQHCIGYYDDEGDAAADYSRALFKYKGRVAGQGHRGSFVIDLNGVPPQSPIPKSSGHVKEGASKYTGVCFNKKSNKWQAQINLDGKSRLIGYYDDENEAAVDFARAVFKYKGAVKRQSRKSFVIDLSGIASQPPILKSSGRIKQGASKYTGVSFNKQSNRWIAQIMIEGKQHRIGYYDDEEEAAADYARAVFKYRASEHKPKPL
ncbi:hypothetical protein ACHAWC_003822 [Mediolabrus comicus]